MSIKKQITSIINKISQFNFTNHFYLRTIIIGFVLSTTAQQSFGAQLSWQKDLDKGDELLSASNIGQAEQYYKKAISQLNLVKHSPSDQSRCFNAYANALTLENRIEESTITYQNSLSNLEKSYGKNSVKLLPTLFAVGSLYEATGDHGTAMCYYKRALTIDEKQRSAFYPTYINQLPLEAKQSNHLVELNDNQHGNLVSLFTQASLSDSKKLENISPGYKEDLLKTEDTSDRDLTSIFNNELKKDLFSNSVYSHQVRNNDIVSTSTNIAQPGIKQSNCLKHSSRI